MAACARRFSTLAALLAMAAVLVPAGNAASPGQAALPTLYVVYTLNCTFSIVDDAGHPVNQIPPGTYQIEVSTPIMFKLVVPGGPTVDQVAPDDFRGCKGWVQFQLTGPGVSLFTTLDSGCDAFYLLPATTFKASSTYTATDLNQPNVAHASFSTLATGTPVVPKSPYGTTSGKGQSQKDLACSACQTTTVKGTLLGALSTVGAPTLKTKGKSVSILKNGRYKFSIDDQSPKASFVLKGVTGPSKGVLKDLTETKFVGKHSVYVTLKAGRWMYYSNPKKAFYFLVTS